MGLKLGYALLGLVLVGCGGGGSGSTPAPQGMQLAFTPGTLEASFYQGEGPTFEVAATAGGVLPDPGSQVNVGVVDATGVLQPDAQIMQTSSTTFKATLKVAPTLGAGVHKGAIVVRACLDDPRTCARPVAGSPWNLSYSFTVRPETDAHVLAPLPDSSNHFGSAGHNALSSAVLDPSRFNRRWSNANAFATLPSAAGGGQLFVTGWTTLTAYSERDGTQTWQRNFEDAPVTGPTWAGDRVFMITTSRESPAVSTLRSFDVTSGQPLAQVQLRDRVSTSANPVVRDGKVYLCESAYSMSRFDAKTLTKEWTASLDGIGGNPLCSPAVDDRHVYIYQQAGFFIQQPSLQVFDRDTGVRLFWIAAPSEGYVPPSLQQAPVLGPNGRVYFALWSPWSGTPFVSRLIAFDTVKRSVLWNVVGSRFSSHAVVGNDAIYIVNGSWLEARSPDTGEVLWTWMSGESGLGDFEGGLVVSGKHAFVSNFWRTLAVDLTTRKEVWRDNGGGPMTLSPNGALYVQRHFDGGMRAFNLQ